MENINMTKACNKLAQSIRPEMKDWGFSFMAGSELDALRIAYTYRNSPHGTKVEHCPAVGKFMVTVFNETAKLSGIDVS